MRIEIERNRTRYSSEDLLALFNWVYTQVKVLYGDAWESSLKVRCLDLTIDGVSRVKSGVPRFGFKDNFLVLSDPIYFNRNVCSVRVKILNPNKVDVILQSLLENEDPMTRISVLAGRDESLLHQEVVDELIMYFAESLIYIYSSGVSCNELAKTGVSYNEIRSICKRFNGSIRITKNRQTAPSPPRSKEERAREAYRVYNQGLASKRIIGLKSLIQRDVQKYIRTWEGTERQRRRIHEVCAKGDLVYDRIPTPSEYLEELARSIKQREEKIIENVWKR